MPAKDAIEKLRRDAEAKLAELRVAVRSAKGRAQGFEEAAKLLETDETQGSIRKKLEDKARRERQSAEEAEGRIHEAEALISAYEDTLKLFAKEADDQSAPELRPGSELFRVREYIQQLGKPADMADLLKHLGKIDNAETRNSLRGSIGRYARTGSIFVKTAPNQFGLISLGHKQSDLPDEQVEQ